MMIGGRYELQKMIGAGGMGTVHRAWDKLASREVAVKRLDTREAAKQLSNTTTDYTGFHVQLAREFNILASLHHPHIIKVLDYGFEEEQKPYFVMELLQGAKNIIDASSQTDFQGKLGYLFQVLQALVYLNRRGILHRDLKPDNILVVNGHVRVLDFGIAVMNGAISQDRNKIAGTFAYMPPEVIGGEPATPQSDMYSLGMVAYEMFAGEYPFNLKSIQTLLMDVLNRELDATDLDIPEDIGLVINRMLSKKPEDRPNDARQVLRELAQLTHHPASAETTAIRESYLHRAQFVGRGEHMEQLKTALASARNGKGSLWLVGGESGIGKSRLLDELRIWSLIKGDQVWVGQATRERTNPFQTWYNPLCQLTLSNSELITDVDAGVLKKINPNIEKLLDRPVDSIDLSGDALVKALNRVVSNALMQQTRCTLIILEDLHWSVSSLELLKRLTPMLAHMRVMVVGSYRSDERPDLPDLLPQANVIQLSRFKTMEIQQLVISIMGENDAEATLTQRLHHETEGNPFFVTEIIRQLAHSAGELQNIKSSEMPERISSKNIRQMLKRRFDNIPADARSFLDLAAVAGRELNLPLLQQTAKVTAEEMDRWLIVGSNASVLDVKGENWRFSHGKIREMLLETLPDAAEREFHRMLAVAIEGMYEEDDDTCTLTLAYHWQGAGDIEKQRQYVLKAAELSMHYSDFESAVQWYETALQIVDDIDPAGQVAIYTGLGEAYNMLSKLDEASQHLEAALEICKQQNDPPGIAQISNRLGIIAFRQNTPYEALMYFDYCLDMYRLMNDTVGEERTLNQLGGIYIELGDEETALKYYQEAMRFHDKR